MKLAETSLAHRRDEQAAGWAASLADGGLGPVRQAEFEAWLDEAPANGEALEEIVGAWDAVEHYAAAEPMMALREAALASARRSAKARRPVPPLFWGAGIAAALVLTIGIATGWALTQPAVYTTGLGERRTVALSDGSKLSLDADSQVAVHYTGKERRLWLRKGRAQFEVAKNPLRPFSVEAAQDVVVATGTAFSVELVQKQVRVVLYEGHVALLERGPSGARPILTPQRAAADRLLTPGREIILAQRAEAPTLTASTVERPSPVVAALPVSDPVRSLAWEEGQLAFQDEPLSVVAERMNRYAEKPLVLTDAATGAARISGVFRAGDTDALIEGLAAGFDVRARPRNDAILLSKPGA